MSRRVPGRVACPWRLYYTRYYTGAAISTSQPTGTPIRRARTCHPTPRIRDQRIWPALALVRVIANDHALSRPFLLN